MSRQKYLPLQEYEVAFGGSTSFYDADEDVPFPLHEDYSPRQVKMLWDISYGCQSGASGHQAQMDREAIASDKFADLKFTQEFEASVLTYMNEHMPRELLFIMHSIFIEALLVTCEKHNIPFGDKVNFHRLRQLIEEQRRRERLGIKGSRQTSLRRLIKRIRPYLGTFRDVEQITQEALAGAMGLEDARALRKLLKTHNISWEELKKLLKAYLSRP